ncbi:MAG: response regulator transcription factor [Rhodospirillales bacterium]|nr:response regulator transcription factor [Rhodospirillales bacterium]
MTEPNFENVSIVVGDPDDTIGTGLRDALKTHGFGSIKTTNAFEDIENAVATNSADLILTDVNLEGGDVFELVRNLRNMEIGDNPFAMVVATVEVPDKECINRILNAGFDDTIVKPFSTDDLMKRISRLAHGRKPFVITRDYIGPDRRLRPRPDAKAAPMVEAPNSIYSKAIEAQPPQEFQKLVGEATELLKAYRIGCYAGQIVWLVERILPSGLDDQISKEIDGYLTEMIEICAATLVAIAETPMVSESITFSAASDIAISIKDSPDKPDSNQFVQLQDIADFIDKFVRIHCPLIPQPGLAAPFRYALPQSGGGFSYHRATAARHRQTS